MKTSPSIIEVESEFMVRNVGLFFQRFALSYFREGPCIEYFIEELRTGETVSSSLIFSYSTTTRNLHVSRFYPELYRLPHSKYLSAACFYLLAHHCYDLYSLDRDCHITLETVPLIGAGFYGKLRDFNFRVIRSGLGDVVELSCDIIRSIVDTSMIKAHEFKAGEIPFLK